MRINTIGYNHKRIGKSKYKYVNIQRITGQKTCKNRPTQIVYTARISKWNWTCTFDDEREAAKAVDLKFIEMGEEPRNILKRK